MVLSGSHNVLNVYQCFLLVLMGSQCSRRLSVVLSGCRRFSVVLVGSLCFSVLLVGSHRSSVLS